MNFCTDCGSRSMEGNTFCSSYGAKIENNILANKPDEDISSFLYTEIEIKFIII